MSEQTGTTQYLRTRRDEVVRVHLHPSRVNQVRRVGQTEAKEKRETDEANEREVERLELEKRRQAALPDIDKLIAYTDQLLDLKHPKIASPSSGAVLGQIDRKLLECQKLVTDFAKELES